MVSAALPRRYDLDAVARRELGGGTRHAFATNSPLRAVATGDLGKAQLRNQVRERRGPRLGGLAVDVDLDVRQQLLIA